MSTMDEIKARLDAVDQSYHSGEVGGGFDYIRATAILSNNAPDDVRFLLAEVERLRAALLDISTLDMQGYALNSGLVQAMELAKDALEDGDV